VCEGALPGFERREVKRGRPRKNRPDMAERVEKASRARRMDDARRGSEDTGAYDGSSPSSSGASDPYTPPHVADAYNEVMPDEAHLEAFLRTYQDTPPTSPLTGGASPAVAQDGFNASFNFANTAQQQQHSTVSNEFTSIHDHVSPHALTATDSSPLLTSLRSPALAVAGGSQSQYYTDTAVFDWAAISSQPALTQDAHSPTAGSSSSHESEEDFDNGSAFDAAFGPSSSLKNSSAEPTFEALLGLDGSAAVYGHGGLSAGLSSSTDVFSAQMDDWLQEYL